MFRKDKKPRTRLRTLADAPRPLPDVEARSLSDDELREAGGAMMGSAPGHLDNGPTKDWTEPLGDNGIYRLDYD